MVENSIQSTYALTCLPDIHLPSLYLTLITRENMRWIFLYDFCFQLPPYNDISHKKLIILP